MPSHRPPNMPHPVVDADAPPADFSSFHNKRDFPTVNNVEGFLVLVLSFRGEAGFKVKRWWLVDRGYGFRGTRFLVVGGIGRVRKELRVLHGSGLVRAVRKFWVGVEGGSMVVAGGSERLVVDEGGDGDAIKRLAMKGWWPWVGWSVTSCRFEYAKRNY